MSHTPCTVLVVGNTTTSADVADLTSFACDVADRLGYPTVVAVGRDYDPMAYEAVVLADGWEKQYESAALGAEAMLSDVCTLWADAVYEYSVNITCGLCGDVNPEAAPVAVNGGWSVSLCPECAQIIAPATSSDVLPVAA
ncbi:hypothetical protein [Streptomyces sp. NPDC003015]